MPTGAEGVCALAPNGDPDPNGELEPPKGPLGAFSLNGEESLAGGAMLRSTGPPKGEENMGAADPNAPAAIVARLGAPNGPSVGPCSENGDSVAGWCASRLGRPKGPSLPGGPLRLDGDGAWNDPERCGGVSACKDKRR